MTTPNEELRKENDTLRAELNTTEVLLEECKMDWSGDVTQIKAEHKHEIDQLRAQLAEIEKAEPVAWMSEHGHLYETLAAAGEYSTPLFTRPMPAESNAELVEAAYDEVQRQIVERYRVEKSIGGFWPCCVKAGDGTMDIFVGSKKQAEHVRQALQTACLDGAFMMSNAALSKYKGAK